MPKIISNFMLLILISFHFFLDRGNIGCPLLGQQGVEKIN